MVISQGYISYFIVSLLSFCILDGIWLGVIAKEFFKRYLGPLMRSDFQWWAAGLFYLIFSASFVYFVALPAREGSAWQAALRGAFFGFTAYAAYDLTNLATLKGFPPIVVAVDLVWGASICAVTALVCYYSIK